jgi:hypothetical protein
MGIDWNGVGGAGYAKTPALHKAEIQFYKIPQEQFHVPKLFTSCMFYYFKHYGVYLIKCKSRDG